MTQLDLGFVHGLGDTSNFARLAKVYMKHGFDLGIYTSPDKQLLIKATGARVLDTIPKTRHPWFIQNGKMDLTPSNKRGWECNKSGVNMRHYGLGEVATMEQLWEDLINVKIDIKSLVNPVIVKAIEDHVNNWVHPITLWHSIGNTNRSDKSYTEQQHWDFIDEFLQTCPGTLVILDWNSRVPWTAHNRLKNMIAEFGSMNLEQLAALMMVSDLMVGIDSGPYYFSQVVGIPSVGVYFDKLHPSEYMIPTSQSLAVTSGIRGPYDAGKRFEFQIVDYDRKIRNLARICQLMLANNKYTDSLNCSRAADVQLQYLIETKCRNYHASGGISRIYDRNKSFDKVLSEAKHRFDKPNIVETGCMRSPEDWGGAGYSTMIFGRYAQLTGGTFTSFDLSEKNVSFAAAHTKQFGDKIKIVCSRGDDGLKGYMDKIDILYLDSLDTEVEGHEDCNLDEFKAAESKLNTSAIVIIDDTPTLTTGKGPKTIEYMKSKGWKILYMGYQVVLSKLV